MQSNFYPARTIVSDVVDSRSLEKGLLLFALTVLDAAMVGLGFWMAYLLRFETNFRWFYQHEIPPTNFYRLLVFLLIPLWVVVFRLFGLYDFKNLFQGMREYMQIFNACTLGIMLVIVSTFFDPDLVIARAWVVMSWLLVGFSVGAGRFIFRRLVQHLRRNGHLLTRVLIIGTDEEAQAIAQQLYGNPKAGVEIVGFVDERQPAGSHPLPDVPVLGKLHALSHLIESHNVHEIIISATALPRQKLLDLFQTFGMADNLTIRLSSGLYEMMTTGVEVQELGNVPLLSVNKVRLTGSDLVLKNLIDFVASLIGLLVALPLMIIIGIAVRLDSPGPIIYKRRVVGVGGKRFDAYKFRTMYVDGDERLARYPELVAELEKNQKLKNDPRVTRLGKFLRRTSLDELPQLFNVLRGQMSLVGPRMITEKERALYGKWRTNLLTVKPGITGLWQVSGRSDLSYDERVRLDMHYIRNYSIWLDLYLLWQTVPAVLKKRGAY